MRRRFVEKTAVILGFMMLTAGVFAQQAPAGRDAAQAPGRGQGDGRGTPAAADAATRPPLAFKEEWQQPPYTGDLTDEKRRVTQDAVTNSSLELKLYGTDVKNIEVYTTLEGGFNLWSGMATSPVAVTLRDRNRYFDLTGLARLRWMVRTQALHAVNPVLKLADGTLIAGTHGVSTEGDYIETEIAFGSNMRWYKLDPQKVVTTVEVKNPDLSKVDEVGWVDLAPSGGHGIAGWHNMSTLELYAKGVPRQAP